jgi:hypothetical protein
VHWRSAALAFLLGSVGPTAVPATVVADPSDCPGACAQPVRYKVDPAFDAEERALIVQALDVWQRGTGGRACFVPGGEDLFVERLERAQELEPWDPDWARHVALAKGGHVWIVNAAVPEAGAFRALVVHEIGHTLGLGHVEDTPLTYMHSAIGDTPAELRDTARLPERDRLDYCAEHVCTCAR